LGICKQAVQLGIKGFVYSVDLDLRIRELLSKQLFCLSTSDNETL
jgi:hypothetical protein